MSFRQTLVVLASVVTGALLNSFVTRKLRAQSQKNDIERCMERIRDNRIWF